MKNTGIHSALFILVLALINFASLAVARADDQSHEDAVALLTSGIWHFAGSNWSNDRVFNANGTVLVRAGNARGVIKWKMDDKQVTIRFADHEDILYLPIDPKGTKGMDQHGEDIVATLVPGSGSGAASTSSGLSSLPPIGASMDGGQSQDQETITSLLTSKKWRFDGANWSEVRSFDSFGNMTIENDTRTARWQVTAGKIVMIFKNHKDILFLPLDPKGTKGQDEYGRLFIATVDTGAPPATATAPSSPATSAPASSGNGNSYFGNSSSGGTVAPAPPSQ